MDSQWGIPILKADTIYQFMEESGIRPWEEVEPTSSLENYLKRELSAEQLAELRFAPKTEVVSLRTPRGDAYRGFRTALKPWATTFCLLPGDLVPIIGEFKHGAFTISLAPPSGVLGKADDGDMSRCAAREFTEETGIKLASLEDLSHGEGIPLNCRHINQRYFPFLGIAELPVEPGKSKLDDNEFIKLVLLPLDEWLKLIETGQVHEECSIGTTYLALRHLSRLQLTS